MTRNKGENIRKAAGMIHDASKRGADIVCLPELFAWPYFPRTQSSAVQAEPIPGPTTKVLSEAAAGSGVVLVGGSVYESGGRARYNTSVIFDEKGEMLAKYRKVHIPHDSHFFEQAYFAPGDGYTVVGTSHGRVGVLICFDQWYPEPARINRQLGAQILFYPTAIGEVQGVEQSEGNWQEAWETVQRGHAIANSMIVCAANRVGVEGDMTFWGGSFVSDQFGKILYRADDKECTAVVACDLRLGAEVEDGWGFFRNRKANTYRRILR